MDEFIISSVVTTDTMSEMITIGIVIVGRVMTFDGEGWSLIFQCNFKS